MCQPFMLNNMEQDKLNIEDNSADKEFFTIIPNYILNHSSALDQALYLQLKRLAGDRKSNYCYPSFRYLKKQLGVGETNLKKAFQYIITYKWIDSLGKRRVSTKGGKQWVSAYKINDIWKLNMDYYRNGEGVPNQEHLEKSEVSPIQPKVSPEIGKVSPVIPTKEEPLKKELLKKDVLAMPSIAINPLIEKFKTINPSYELLFKNTTQRQALERLVKKHGEEAITKIIDILPKIFGKLYAPRITTPHQLEQKLGDLFAYLKERSEEKINFVDLTKL